MTQNIHQRLHSAMQHVSYIQKEQKKGMQYSIVSHDAVTAKVRPALMEAGIVYYPVSMTREQAGNRTEIDLTVRFVNVEKPDDYIDVQSCGYGIDQQDKGPGKAISYAVKYALLKALGLETGDDPEMDQSSEFKNGEAILREATSLDELRHKWEGLNPRERHALENVKQEMKAALSRRAA